MPPLKKNSIHMKVTCYTRSKWSSPSQHSVAALRSSACCMHTAKYRYWYHQLRYSGTGSTSTTETKLTAVLIQYSCTGTVQLHWPVPVPG